MKHLILASTSPRRQEILRNAGIEFSVATSDYEEDMTQDMPPTELVKELSKGKAQAVAEEHPDAVILAADTIVAFEGRVLGKPYSTEGIIESISMLNGKQASAITGFTIIAGDEVYSEAVESEIHFRQLSQSEIENYAATGEGLDKAGGFGIQGIGALLFERIDGDFYTIVGLPICAVAKKLGEFGIDTPLTHREA